MNRRFCTSLLILVIIGILIAIAVMDSGQSEPIEQWRLIGPF